MSRIQSTIERRFQLMNKDTFQHKNVTLISEKNVWFFLRNDISSLTLPSEEIIFIFVPKDALCSETYAKNMSDLFFSLGKFSF